MAWVILLFAGLLEIAWAVGLKYTDGFTRLWPTVATLSSAWMSFVLLGLAMKTLPVGTAYGVWVAIGIIGTVILGMLLFNEPMSLWRVISVLLIVVGVMGLKLTT